MLEPLTRESQPRLSQHYGKEFPAMKSRHTSAKGPVVGLLDTDGATLQWQYNDDMQSDIGVVSCWS